MELLNENSLKKYLKRDFTFYDSIGSTFDDKNSPIVVAATQGNGKGRFSRKFFSPIGGIYFNIRTEARPLLTINSAVGVMRAMEKIGINAKVKWVNDIFLKCNDKLNNSKPYGNCNSLIENNNDIVLKKVCGILAKALNNSATIGVGINYFIPNFPDSLKETATSLMPSSDGINEFTSIVIEEIFSSINKNNLDFYRSRLLGINKEITLNDGNIGIIKGVDENGHLLYLQNSILKSLNFGDILI